MCVNHSLETYILSIKLSQHYYVATYLYSCILYYGIVIVTSEKEIMNESKDSADVSSANPTRALPYIRLFSEINEHRSTHQPKLILLSTSFIADPQSFF